MTKSWRRWGVIVAAAATMIVGVAPPALAAPVSEAQAASLPAPTVVWDHFNYTTYDVPTLQGTPTLVAPGATDVSYEYELDGSGIWVAVEAPPEEYAGQPGFWITGPRITAGEHSIRVRAIATIGGQRVTGTPTQPVLERATMWPTPGTVTTSITADSITFSWDVRANLGGWPGDDGFYLLDGEFSEGFVGPVGSVTVTPGPGRTVTFMLVYGGFADYIATAEATASTPPAPSLTSTPLPSIVGTAMVGNTLTARTGTWQPAPVALAYQWLRDGAPIAGATAVGYAVTAADAGARLTVAVTGSKSGYASATKTSAPTVRVPVPVLTSRVPSIVGIAAAGNTLTAYPGIWGPAPVSLAYQWSRNGAPVAGATGSTFALTAADRGTSITVSVTGTKAEYASVTTTSGAKRIR